MTQNERSAVNKEDFRRLCPPGCGIQHILDRSLTWLENPSVLLDTSYKLLGHSENPVQDDPLWNELLALGTFSCETVDFFNRAQFIAAFADSELVAPMRADSLPYDRACGKIFDGDGIQVGSLTVVACLRPFAEGDFERIITVCERISEENSAAAPPPMVERFFQKSWFSDLLDGKTPDSSQIDFYEDLKANLFVAVADISQYERTGSHLAYFQDVFSALQPEYQYFIYLNNVVILMSGDGAMVNVKKDLRALHDYFDRHNIFAGVSGAFQNLFDLKKYYKQALDALNQGMSQPCRQKIFQRETFGVDCFLSAISDTVNLWELCNPMIWQIQEFDRSRETAYLDTLYIYLLNAKNETRTCNQLRIAPTALQARLGQMEELFDIDWDDGNQLSSLLISLKILKQL